MKEHYKKLVSYLSSEYVAFGGLALYLVCSILSSSFYEVHIPSAFLKLSFLGVIVVILLRDFLVNKQDKRSLIGLLLLCLIAILFVKTKGQYSRIRLLAAWSLIYGLREDNPKKLAEVAFLTTLTTWLFIVLSSEFGIIKNYIEVASFRTRHYLGFRYSLYPSTYVLNIILMATYIKQQWIKFWQIILLFTLNVWTFIQTGSRLTFISSCVILLLITLIKVFPQILKIRSSILNYFSFSYWAATALSFWAVMSYNPVSSVWTKLNSFLGGRIALSIKSLELYGMKLFGGKVEWVGNGLDMHGKQLPGNYLFVDNLYINIAQRFGIVFLLLLLVLMTAVIYKAIKNNEFILAMILTIIAFHGIIDNLMFLLHYNMFWLFIGIVLLGSVSNTNKEQQSKEQIQPLTSEIGTE